MLFYQSSLKPKLLTLLQFGIQRTIHSSSNSQNNFSKQTHKMATSNVVAISAPLCHSSLLCTNSKSSNVNYFVVNSSNKPQKVLTSKINNCYSLKFRPNVTLQRKAGAVFPLRAASSSSAVSSEYTEEPETKVKFQTLLNLPGCSSTLSFLGAGYREKVIAIIGVKVYAAALYANQSIFSNLDAWRGRSAAELQQDSSLFDAIFQTSLEKSLHIVLVRDVDGKTFWDALGEAISPRITSPTPVDESALSTFRTTFEGRALKKGTSIFLTWLDTSKMLVSVSSDGKPSAVDATIESSNVTSVLFDVFLGRNPVSPTLKASVSNGLAASLK